MQIAVNLAAYLEGSALGMGALASGALTWSIVGGEMTKPGEVTTGSHNRKVTTGKLPLVEGASRDKIW